MWYDLNDDSLFNHVDVGAYAHRSDRKRFIVRADEMLTAFLELESAIQACRELT
jgi:hypothetical protein